MCDTQNLMNENVSICMNNWNANNKIRGSTNCSWLVTRVSNASFPFHAISFFGENVLAKSAQNIVPLLLMEIVLKMEFNLLFTHLFMALSKEIVNGTDAHRATVNVTITIVLTFVCSIDCLCTYSLFLCFVVFLGSFAWI